MWLVCKDLSSERKHIYSGQAISLKDNIENISQLL